MEVNLVEEGFKFLVLGMGTVFVFLMIMIFFMNLLGKIIDRFFPDAPSEPTIQNYGNRSKKNKIAAIMGAILKHNQAK